MTGNGRALIFFVGAFFFLAGLVSAQPSSFLYTQPDEAAPGGIRGRIIAPRQPIRRILAVPSAQPEQVYDGQITGPDRQEFSFSGLPMGRYDLFVVYNDRFYEGLVLSRREDTLTTEDRQQIADIIDRSERFFSVKIIHRLEGQTGRGGAARAVTTFGRENLRRTYKLVLLRQVGPGWQVERSRELYPREIEREPIETPHQHSEVLSGIRVTDSVRDLGDLRLQ